MGTQTKAQRMRLCTFRAGSAFVALFVAFLHSVLSGASAKLLILCTTEVLVCQQGLIQRSEGALALGVQGRGRAPPQGAAAGRRHRATTGRRHRAPPCNTVVVPATFTMLDMCDTIVIHYAALRFVLPVVIHFSLPCVARTTR